MAVVSSRKKAVETLRSRTGAPVALIVRALEQSEGDVDRASQELTRVAIHRIQERADTDHATARRAFERFRWDVDSAVAGIRSDREAHQRRRANYEDAMAALQDATTVGELFDLGQCDDLSTEAERTVYYIAGFFQSFRTLPLFALDCSDTNERLLEALARLGDNTLHEAIARALEEGKNERHAVLDKAFISDQEPHTLRDLQAYVRANRQSFRVLAS